MPYTEIIALSSLQLTIKPSFANYAYSQEPLSRLEFTLLLISFGFSLISNLRQTILSTNCAGPSAAFMEGKLTLFVGAIKPKTETPRQNIAMSSYLDSQA